MPSAPRATPPPSFDFRELVGQLEGGTLRLDDDTREAHARDETEDLRFLPAAVALPTSTEEVQTILRFAHAHRIPVTPRGGGTGLSGGALPVEGGIVLSLARMNRIREIDRRNLVAVAEAGVVTADLQRAVEAVGLFYPPDPSSRESCQLGGNIAEDAAGPRSARYGTTRRWVLGLEAVLADGSRLSAGGKNRKDATGYNLVQLLVGSEGTLAVVTAATLRLVAKPAATLTMILPFDELEAAASAVERIFSAGFDPAACEIAERAALEAVARVWCGRPAPPQPARESPPSATATPATATCTSTSCAARSPKTSGPYGATAPRRSSSARWSRSAAGSPASTVSASCSGDFSPWRWPRRRSRRCRRSRRRSIPAGSSIRGRYFPSPPN
jgi:FAD/FMN-containing dehydrogenase